MQSQATADSIERTLATAVLRGQYPAGSRLPTLRELATRFDANVATVQRAIARLEMSGLVTARKGSGIRVNDPETHGDLALVPLRLAALSDQPERATSVLADLLEVRRVLAARLIVRHRAKLARNADKLAAAMAGFVKAAKGDLAGIVEADMVFARTLLQVVDNAILLAVIRTAERTIREVPGVAEAMYADPDIGLATMTDVVGAFDADDVDDAVLSDRVERLIERVDRGTLERYRATLERRLVDAS